jgi:hypothetical protein
VQLRNLKVHSLSCDRNSAFPISRRSMLRLLVTANVVSSSPILFTLITEEISSSETSSGMLRRVALVITDVSRKVEPLLSG